jgi:isochorismate hydrolase
VTGNRLRLDLEKTLRELEHHRVRKARIDPGQAALLVIDMQNYFRQIAQPVLNFVVKVIHTCHRKGIPIIFTQHGHDEPSSDGGMLKEWWGELILSGTNDWEFLPEITIEPGDIVLPKKRYSAFFETSLDKTLHNKRVRDLIISGVMTNLCCETTARDAFMRDYRVFFLIDGTATGNTKQHLASLRNLGYGFSYLLTCDEVIQMLSGD